MITPNIDEIKALAQHAWVFRLDGYLFGGGDIYKEYGKDNMVNDIFKCEINYDKNIITYYVNNICQGIAFKNVSGYVKPIVSMSIKDHEIELIDVK